MLLSHDTGTGDFLIRSYEPGKLVINKETYLQSVIISPNQLITDWPPQHIAELKSTHLIGILEQQPEVVLLGVGERLQFPPTALLAPLINHQIGVEVMDTRAACHTFNVLIAEGRRVIAALLIQ